MEKEIEIAQSDDFFESEPVGLKAGVRIMELRKVLRK